MEPEETTALEVQKAKTPINIDLSGGIIPRNYDELMQYAALYKASELAPSSFKKTSQIAIAIAMCMEVGRPIITGLGDMAVINGRVGLFGDAPLAMVRSSGLLEAFEEWSEGAPFEDNWTFYCKVKRKGYPEKVQSWSWAESKRAGFDDPKKKDGSRDMYSPWRRFTARMMQFKARAFVLRDQFGDILKGVKIAEELEEIIDVTPEEVISTPESGQAAPNGTDPYAAKAADFVKPEPEKKEPAPAEPPELKVTEQEEPTPPIESSPEEAAAKAAFRKEWINTRTRGFATYVYKNVLKVKSVRMRWPGLYEEMKGKWHNLYPDQAWPIPATEAAQEPAPEKAEPTPESFPPPADHPASMPGKTYVDKGSEDIENRENAKPYEKNGNTFLYCPDEHTRKGVDVCATKCPKGMKGMAGTCDTYKNYLEGEHKKEEGKKQGEATPPPPPPGEVVDAEFDNEPGPPPEWANPKQDPPANSNPNVPCPERDGFPVSLDTCNDKCPRSADGSCKPYKDAVGAVVF